MKFSRILRLVVWSLVILSNTAGIPKCTVKTDNIRLGENITINLPGSTFSQCKANGARVMQCENRIFFGEDRWTDHIRGSCDQIQFLNITDDFYKQIICEDLHDHNICVDIRLKKPLPTTMPPNLIRGATKLDSTKEPSTPPTPTTTVHPTTTIGPNKGSGDSSGVQLSTIAWIVVGLFVGGLIVGVLVVGLLHSLGKLTLPCCAQKGAATTNGTAGTNPQEVPLNSLNGRAHAESE
ncbi:uncharacterized protein LOC134444400 [Engraulis encrasicolus]|uniref:uncharacterized protein LOC134444400 n=1 Tax=Engraulis encrasicolus TaxID=184585 RepID=UPI002FD24B5D